MMHSTNDRLIVGLMKFPDLKEIIGYYYNGKWSYYDTLAEIMTWWHTQEADGEDTIVAVDEALECLREGYKRVLLGGRIEYDGMNFALLSKED